MAHILPETLPQVFPGEVLKTFRSLKALPDSYFIWHHLAPWQRNMPDFLIITRQGCALLVKVSSASAGQATTAAQLLLIDDDRILLAQRKLLSLKNFIRSLKLPENVQIETLTIFPNIPHKQVLESRLERSAGEPQWAGKELLAPQLGGEVGRFLASRTN